MQEALALVRRELGPQAAVLHTREAPMSRLLSWMPGMRRIEVTASADVVVPSRLGRRAAPAAVDQPARQVHDDGKRAAQDEFLGQISQLHSMVEDLCRRSKSGVSHDLPPAYFTLFTDLIEADLSEELARDLVDRVRAELASTPAADEEEVKHTAARLIEGDLRASGPILPRGDRCHVAALVGPTGVGKTTTIAKLAANYRLRDKRRVGLITVDTFRIAAVEQLRTYADIIDLPMQVVTTPSEMREAVRKMSDLDLVLIDTAGRSPKDEVRIRELRTLLGEAQVDEVHLVLSAVSSAASLTTTAKRFAPAGATNLLLTKLDEAAGLGCLVPLARSCQLPISYVTNGQNVPDDIEPANSRRLAAAVLGQG